MEKCRYCKGEKGLGRISQGDGNAPCPVCASYNLQIRAMEAMREAGEKDVCALFLDTDRPFTYNNVINVLEAIDPAAVLAGMEKGGEGEQV